MTKEEAIKELRIMIKYSNQRRIEALDIAIKALRQYDEGVKEDGS